MKCKNESLQDEEKECQFCNGTGYSDVVTLGFGELCSVCGGTGYYIDTCYAEHAEEYELDLYHQSKHMEPENDK